jgi:hypothetical protein
MKTIFVYGNCQVKSLVPSLQILLAGQVTVSGIWDFHPSAPEMLAKAVQDRPDLILLNGDEDKILDLGWSGKVKKIPSIYFGGFHPDTIYFRTDNGRTPLFFKNNASISAIALWSFKNRLSVQEAEKLFRSEVFLNLGYFDYFQICLRAIAEDFRSHGLPVGLINQFLSRRSVFMWGPLHPKMELVMAFAGQICDSLGIDVGRCLKDISSLVNDPLQGEYAWGVYPPIASQLGIEGSWCVRHHTQLFLNTKSYLDSFYNDFASVNPDDIEFAPEDKRRFAQLHQIDSVLPRFC